MELKELQQQKRILATMEETDAVVMTRYLNLQNGGVSYRDCFQNHISLFRKTLTGRQVVCKRKLNSRRPH